jgi:hypothetical protein
MSYARHKECTPEQVKGFIAKYMKERITEAPEYVQLLASCKEEIRRPS